MEPSAKSIVGINIQRAMRVELERINDRSQFTLRVCHRGNRNAKAGVVSSIVETAFGRSDRGLPPGTDETGISTQGK